MTGQFLQWLSPTVTQHVALALLHFLWQGMLVTSVVAVILRLLRDDLASEDDAMSDGSVPTPSSSRANIRYTIACVGLLVMAALPILNLLIVVPHIAAGDSLATVANGLGAQEDLLQAPGGSEITSASAPGMSLDIPAPRQSEPTAAVPIPSETSRVADDRAESMAASPLMRFALQCCFWIWITGVAVLSAWHAAAWSLSQRFRRLGVTATDEVLCVVKKAARRLGIRRAIAVRQTVEATTPVVIGWIKPVLVLPMSILTGLSPAELEAVLAHELTHIRRHDYLVNLVQAVIETVLFYHPAVWWLSRRIRCEREFCADDLAMSVCQGREVYARSLVTLAEIARTPPAHSVAATGGRLMQRIRRVMHLPDGRSESRRFVTRTSLVAVMAILCVGAVVMAAAQIQSPNEERSWKDAEAVGEPAVSQLLPDISSTPRDSAINQQERTVSFNFKGRSWQYVMEWIADISQMSLDWQELPDGYFNLVTQRKYNVAEARDMVNRHLLTRGFTMLIHDEVISVLTIESINPAMVPRVTPEELANQQPHGFVKVSFELDGLLANQASEELKPMLSPYGKLTPLQATNRVEAMDTVLNLQQIYQMLQHAAKPIGLGRIEARVAFPELRYAVSADPFAPGKAINARTSTFHVASIHLREQDPESQQWQTRLEVKPDADGLFVFESVPAGTVKLVPQFEPDGRLTGLELPVAVTAGETTSVTYGGKGTPVLDGVDLPDFPPEAPPLAINPRPNAEFNLLPVHMKVAMDQQRLQDFLTHVYTRDTPLHVKQLRVKPEDRGTALTIEIDGVLPVFHPPHLGKLVTTDDEKQGQKPPAATVTRLYVRAATDPGSWERVEAALKLDCELEFMEIPLRDVIVNLADAYRIHFVLDKRAFDEAGIAVDIRTSRSVKGISLAEFLDFWIKDLDLTWYVKHNVVLITTPTAAAALSDVRVYRIRTPMIGMTGLITREVSPSSWDSTGGPGSLVPVTSDLLVVKQGYDVHRQIEEHYADKLQAMPPAWDALPPTLADTRLGKELNRNSSLQFIETPLKDVVAHLAKQHRVAITLDETALNDLGLNGDLPITRNLTRLPLRSVLSLFLADLDLTWTADKDEIRITTPEAAEAKLSRNLYLPDDLVMNGPVEPIIDVIQSTIEPHSWDGLGGPGAIRKAPHGALAIDQTFNAHLQISVLLETLRRAKEDDHRSLLRGNQRPLVIDFVDTEPGRFVERRHAGTAQTIIPMAIHPETLDVVAVSHSHNEPQLQIWRFGNHAHRD